MRRDVFQAIADPTRRDIIKLISFNSYNVNAIAKKFAMSRPAISQHIKILEECGLIKMSKQGRERFCEMQPKKLAEVVDWLKTFNQILNEKAILPVEKAPTVPKVKEPSKLSNEQLSMF